MKNIMGNVNMSKVVEVKTKLDLLNDWMESEKDNLMKKSRELHEDGEGMFEVLNFINTSIQAGFDIFDIAKDDMQIYVDVKDEVLELVEFVVKIELLGTTYSKIMPYNEYLLA